MVFKRSKMFICYTMAIYSIFFINEYIALPNLWLLLLNIPPPNLLNSLLSYHISFRQFMNLTIHCFSPAPSTDYRFISVDVMKCWNAQTETPPQNPIPRPIKVELCK